MYVRVPQAMSQFVLKMEKLSHIMEPTPILEMVSPSPIMAPDGNFIIGVIISNGNRKKWSPIRSGIIRVITKSENRVAGVRFVYNEYDYRLNWTTRSLIINQS